MTRKSAAAEAPAESISEKMTELSHAMTAASAVPSTPLPSGNISHAVVFGNELQNRIHGFESGIIALQGELEGSQVTFDADIAELNQKIAERTEKRTAEKADLLRRIDDLQRAKRMATAALDAGDVSGTGGKD